MANTLNLGDGNWATKEDSLLGYNSENNNYKPLPFDFSRASSATVVNKAGLIETVGSGEPRIDFKDNTKGSLLLEPSRSNYWTDSEGSAITLNSPLGEFGFYTLNNTLIDRTITYIGTITFTFIVKKIDGTIPTITTSSGSGDLAVLVNGDSSAGVSGVLTDIGNGFYKYELTTEASGASVARIRNHSGLDTYVSLIQYEQGSYATSYIPTSGSAVTRVADACNNGGNDQVINSTEGVLYAELELLQDIPSANMYFGISSGALVNSIFFRFNTAGDIVAYNAGLGSSNIIALKSASEIDLTSTFKLAVKYGVTNPDFSFYVNGSKISQYGSFSATAVSGLNQYDFALYDGISSPVYGKIKDTRVYNTALTDQELQALTTI